MLLIRVPFWFRMNEREGRYVQQQHVGVGVGVGAFRIPFFSFPFLSFSSLSIISSHLL